MPWREAAFLGLSVWTSTAVLTATAHCLPRPFPSGSHLGLYHRTHISSVSDSCWVWFPCCDAVVRSGYGECVCVCVSGMSYGGHLESWPGLW